MPGEHKPERFLTVLAQKDVAASAQNQAFNAIIFFYGCERDRILRGSPSS
jgi:hypothetical protein